MILHTIAKHPPSMAVKLILAQKNLDCEIQVHGYNNENKDNSSTSMWEVGLSRIDKLSKALDDKRIEGRKHPTSNINKPPRLPILEDVYLNEMPMPNPYLWGNINIARYLNQVSYLPAMISSLPEQAANDNVLIKFINTKIFRKNIKEKYLFRFIKNLDKVLEDNRINGDKKYLLITKVESAVTPTKRMQNQMNQITKPGIIDCFCAAALLHPQVIEYIDKDEEQYKNIFRYRRRMLNRNKIRNLMIMDEKNWIDKLINKACINV